MKLSAMMGSWEKANRFSHLLMLSNVALALTLMGAVYLAIGNRERVVLVPPQLDTRVSLDMSTASSEYLKSFGLYIATLAGNITPYNIEFITDILSRHLDSRVYTAVRTRLRAVADDPLFRSSGGASWFEAKRLDFEKETSRVFVVGQLNTLSAGKSSADVAPVVYDLKIEMRDGRPLVTALNSYEGSEPHTLKWLASPANVQKPAEAKGEK
jgi:conjugal transfer pilus assembly protein TraE